MEIAKKCLEFQRDGKRLEAACVEALSDLLEWQPEDVVCQIFTDLNKLETIQNAQPSAQKRHIPYEIQQQVHGLASAYRSSQLSRPAYFFWLNQLAATINKHDKGGCATAVGRSCQSRIPEYNFLRSCEETGSDSRQQEERCLEAQKGDRWQDSAAD